MNSWNSANLHFEPAIRYYVARRVFHVVYISIVFRWLFKVNRNTPRGGDTRVKQAKEGRVTTSGVPNRRRTLPSRLEPYSSHLEWRVFYLRKEEIFLPFFSLSLFIFFFSSQPLPSRTISPFGLEDQRQRGGGGGEERSKFVTWMIQKKHALRKKEVEIDNYREFLIRVSGFRTSSMIYRRCARSCVRVVSNVYRSCR